MIEVGALVKVHNWAVEDESYGFQEETAKQVEKNGWIYVVQEHDEHQCYMCSTEPNPECEAYGMMGHAYLMKSLATGAIESLLEGEVEVADGEVK